MTEKITVIIASHKKYRMPDDSMYLPLHVGAAGKENIGYQRDDQGDNISELNPFFCELTGLYWAWKNLTSDYIGLAHYRRHFSMHPFRGDVWESVLKYKEIESYLGKIKAFTPKKRKYFIETLYSHYEHTHYGSHLDNTKHIIEEKYPEYIDSYNRVVKRRWGYMFNMMILRIDLLSDYCSWLFDILFELRNRIGDESEKELSKYQGRFYGRISEILFNVWLEKKKAEGLIKKSEIIEIPLIHMEKINWWKKGIAFLKAKFLGKRYEGSF